MAQLGKFGLLVASCLVFPLTASAQLCLGRPQPNDHGLAAVSLEQTRSGKLFMPRVGVASSRIFVTVGRGRRTEPLEGSVTLYQEEVGLMLGNASRSGSHWCPVVRVEQQRGPNRDFTGAPSDVRVNNYSLGLSFANVWGEQRPAALVWNLGYVASDVATKISTITSSESYTGLFVGGGANVLLRPWLSTGLHVRATLQVPGTISRTIGLNVAAGF